jgi:hypothetical protein
MRNIFKNIAELRRKGNFERAEDLDATDGVSCRHSSRFPLLRLPAGLAARRADPVFAPQTP